MMKNCKLCEAETNSVYNINFKAVPICDDCGTTIFLQQAMWYAKQEPIVPPRKYIGVVAYSTKEFVDWITQLRENHPNEFKFKGKSSIIRKALNEVTNIEYICMTQPNNVHGCSLDGFIELQGARQNKQFSEIMNAMMPCFRTGFEINRKHAHEVYGIKTENK